MPYHMEKVNFIRKLIFETTCYLGIIHRDFTYENYHRRSRFTKENSYYSMKHQKNIFTIICNQINKKRIQSILSILFDEKKHKIDETIKSNFSTTKNFRKRKLVQVILEGGVTF